MPLQTKKPTLKEIIECIFEETTDPAHLMELYYWSIDPEVAHMVRYIMRMKPETREVIRAFQMMAEPGTVRAELNPVGTLLITAPGVARVMDVARANHFMESSEEVHKH